MNNTRLMLLIFLGLLMAGAAGYYFIGFEKGTNKQQITNFDECVKAGFPVMESYPAQCRTADGKSFTQTISNENDMSGHIIVDSPRPNQEVMSPFTLSGKARGNWYWEGTFSVSVLDANGTSLGEMPVMATGEWMTEEFVPFEANVTYEQPSTPIGTIVVKNGNASGLPENDKELRIPVVFAKE